MAITRNLITVSAALALCAVQSAVLAREAPLPGQPGGRDKKLGSAASCVREVDRSVLSSGTVNNQYVTRTIKVKNRCDNSHKVTLDIANYPDPKCKKLDPGEAAEFVYSVEVNIQPPPHEYRRIKAC